MVALADLLTPMTTAQVAALQLQLLTLAGLPATAWQSGSVPVTLVNADAQTLSDLTKAVSAIAGGGLLSLATGGWLDLIATSHYALSRNIGVPTTGLITLTDSGGGGPYTIVAGQLYASSTTGIRYTNSTGGTLVKSGSLTLTWQAESAGSSYNRPISDITSLATPLPGVTVNNPENPVGSGTWITKVGTDNETDAQLALRCQNRWPALSFAGPTGAYLFWALNPRDALGSLVTTGVTRVSVLENTPVGGQVTVYLAGPNGGAGTSDVTTINAYIQTQRPLCITVSVFAAVNFSVILTGTVNVKTAQLAAMQASFTAKLAAFATNLAVGATVYYSQLLSLVATTTGVVEVLPVGGGQFQMNAAVGDVSMGPTQVAVFTNSLIFVGV